jgi:hypothetical protein
MDERRLAAVAATQVVVRARTPGTWSIDHAFLGPHCESFFSSSFGLDVAMPIPELARPVTLLVH